MDDHNDPKNKHLLTDRLPKPHRTVCCDGFWSMLFSVAAVNRNKANSYVNTVLQLKGPVIVPFENRSKNCPSMTVSTTLKWSEQTGQSAKVYPKPLKGYEDGKAPEFYRSV